MGADQVQKRWASARELVGSTPPTDDDVPTTLDGEPLDTPEKIRAFVDEINSRRSQTQGE
jgi:hypothetical protein